jgi:hypothetical protein
MPEGQMTPVETPAAPSAPAAPASSTPAAPAAVPPNGGGEPAGGNGGTIAQTDPGEGGNNTPAQFPENWRDIMAGAPGAQIT